MLYKLLLNYLRLKLVKGMVNKFLRQPKGGKNLRTMSVLAYALELLATFYLEGKKGRSKKTRH